MVLIEEMITEPTDEFIAGLTDEQLLACITYHFRQDHFCNGSLTCESIAGGHLLGI